MIEGYANLEALQESALREGAKIVEQALSMHFAAVQAGTAPAIPRTALEIHKAINCKGEDLKPFVAQGVLEALVRMALEGVGLLQAWPSQDLR